MAVEVSVDPELCIGSMDCVRLIPAAFQIDESQGVSVPQEGVHATEVDLLVRAAMGCPTQAIRVVQDGEVLHESN
jgi:ferredoxin